MQKYLSFILIILSFIFYSCSDDNDPKIPKIESINIANKIESIYVGETYLFKVEFSPKEAIDSTAIYAWESSDKSIADIDYSGKLFAKKKGEVKISLTVYAKDNKDVQRAYNDEVTLTILQADIKSIRFDKSSLDIIKGNEYTLTILIEPSNAEIGEIEWDTNNEEVATVSKNGVVTGKNMGQTTIRANLKGTNLFASCKVNVSPVKLISIEFKEKNKTILIDDKFQTEIIYNPDNADYKNVTYTSSNDSIATIDENGIITAKSKGSATITAISEDGSKTTTCIIDVEHLTDRISIVKSGSVVNINGLVTATSIVSINNNSGKTIFVKKFNVISDGKEVYNLDINENLHTSQELSRGISYKNLLLPIYIYTYSVDDEDYEIKINGY